MRSPWSRRTRAIILGASVAVLAAGGFGTWMWARSTSSESACSVLRRDARIQEVLGTSYRSGISCGDLGRALEEAARGDKPGIHSEKEAQAMRDTLGAVGDALVSSKGRGIDRSLRVPLAALLADYVADTHEILKELDADYITHLSDKDPWEDASGVHMTVPNTVLLRVMRAVSGSPSAYAILRSAEGEYSARVMVKIPRAAKGFTLYAPTVGNALALGALDGIAADVAPRLSGQAAIEWDKGVVRGLISMAPAVIPAYTSDPAAYISATWTKGLSSASKVESDTFRSQSVNYLTIWSRGRADGFKSPGKLATDCLNAQFRKYREAVKSLEEDS